jgi:hypothetical protein
MEKSYKTLLVKITILASLAHNRITSTVVAAKLGINVTTLQEKLKDPSLLTLAELQTIARECNMSNQQFLELIGL